MTPAFVAQHRLQPERLSLFDNLNFGAFRPLPRHVRPHLRPEAWPLPELPALLIDRRDPANPATRNVAPDLAAAVCWEGEG
jgi:hypothetical protein